MEFVILIIGVALVVLISCLASLGSSKVQVPQFYEPIQTLRALQRVYESDADTPEKKRLMSTVDEALSHYLKSAKQASSVKNMPLR